MGAWGYVAPRLRLVVDALIIRYIGRQIARVRRGISGLAPIEQARIVPIRSRAMVAGRRMATTREQGHVTGAGGTVNGSGD